MPNDLKSQANRLEREFKRASSKLFSALRKLISNPKTGKVSIKKIIFLLGVLGNLILAIRQLVQLQQFLMPTQNQKWDRIAKDLAKGRIDPRASKLQRGAIRGGRSKVEYSWERQARFYKKNRNLLK